MKFHSKNLIYIIFIILSACNISNDNKVHFQVLVAKEKISHLNDSTYFLSVFSIIQNKGNFMISDIRANHIIEFTNDYDLKQRYGNSGRGPGEFLAAASIFIKNDTIFALDNGNSRFNLFSLSGTFVRTISLPNDLTPNLGKFLIKNESIYISTNSRDLPIVQLDFKGNIIKRFGSNPEVGKLPIRKDFSYNQYHILEDPNNRRGIFVINQEIPIIFRYRIDGELISTIDFSDSPLFKKRFAYISNELKKESNNRAHFIVIQDVCILGNKLYLLYVDRENDRDICNNIIEIDLDNFEIKNVYKLENVIGRRSAYFSFCVVNETYKRIMAFDVISGEIHLFDMKDSVNHNTLPKFPDIWRKNIEEK